MATLPTAPNQYRGFSQPPDNAKKEAVLRVSAEREAMHLFDNFLRDRAEKKRKQKSFE
jgi:hypothetical protein